MGLQNRKRTKKSDLDVLILAPSGKDAESACWMLQQRGTRAIPCRSIRELSKRLTAGCGAIVIAEEALDQASTRQLLHMLKVQPNWSDLPLVLFRGHVRSFWGQHLSRWRNITILTRPIPFQTFFTIVQAAIESRRKQYLVRNLLGELHRVNNHLKSRSKQLQSFALQLTQVEQQERRRIAEDIHDYLAQLLVVCRLKLSQAGQYAERGELGSLVDEIDQRLDEMLVYSRTLVSELSPQVLYQAGLPSALKWLARQMEQYGLKVQIQMANGPFPFSEDTSVLIFQTVRELFFNVMKHSGVDTATLSLRTDEHQRVIITVNDEGKGFLVSKIEEGLLGGVPKFGLFSIRERIEALQGLCRIQSAPGHGTTVTLMLPKP
jgi:signal transduction histidine kinase